MNMPLQLPDVLQTLLLLEIAMGLAAIGNSPTSQSSDKPAAFHLIDLLSIQPVIRTLTPPSLDPGSKSNTPKQRPHVPLPLSLLSAGNLEPLTRYTSGLMVGSSSLQPTPFLISSPSPTLQQFTHIALQLFLPVHRPHRPQFHEHFPSLLSFGVTQEAQRLCSSSIFCPLPPLPRLHRIAHAFPWYLNLIIRVILEHGFRPRVWVNDHMLERMPHHTFCTQIRRAAIPFKGPSRSKLAHHG
jgi:hypothetical protein